MSEKVLKQILYGILVGLCLEYTRYNYNRIAKGKESTSGIQRKQKLFVFRMSLIYAIFFSYIILKSVIPFIGELTRTYTSVTFLTSLWALIFLLFASYGGAVLIANKLLFLYIKTVNKVPDFFAGIVSGVAKGTKVVADGYKGAVNVVADGCNGVVNVVADGHKALADVVAKGSKVVIDKVGGDHSEKAKNVVDKVAGGRKAVIDTVAGGHKAVVDTIAGGHKVVVDAISGRNKESDETKPDKSGHIISTVKNIGRKRKKGD